MSANSEYSDFIKYISLEKRYSKHTVKAYTNDLEDFFAYFEKDYEVKQPGEISHTMLRSWIVKMMEEKYDTKSINRKLTTLRSFYKYLMRQGKVNANPMIKVQGPKNSKRLPVFVEKDKMNQLFSNSTDESKNDFESLRNRLILEMFYATGMRLSELIHLKSADIDRGKKILKVLGKRNKERMIPMTNSLLALTEDYIRLCEREQRAGEGGVLFMNEKGKKLYPKFIYRLVVKNLSEVTTLDKKSPHVLRHTFATHMLNNGADINAIKEILGHANLSATQIYTHNTIEKLKNIHSQAHPRG